MSLPRAGGCSSHIARSPSNAHSLTSVFPNTIEQVFGRGFAPDAWSEVTCLRHSAGAASNFLLPLAPLLQQYEWEAVCALQPSISLKHQGLAKRLIAMPCTTLIADA